MLRILTYHRIGEPERTPELDPGQISATPDGFARQMEHVASRYDAVGLEQVAAAVRGGPPLPRRAVLITFDDAYREVGEVAWPILRDLGLPAVVFVPTAFPGRPNPGFWWDRIHRALSFDGDGCPVRPASALGGVKELIKSLPPEQAEETVDRVCADGGGGLPPPERPPVLCWEELRALREEGMEVGSHTHTHAALAHATRERIQLELRRSMLELTDRLGPLPRTICYPYGIVDERVVRVAREEGFELGFSALDGLNRIGRADPLLLRRTNITPRTTPMIFRIRMHPWFAPIDRWRHRSRRSGPEPGARARGGRPGWERGASPSRGARGPSGEGERGPGGGSAS